MDLSLSPLVLYRAAWLGIVTGVWTLFDQASKVLKPEAIERVSQWLRSGVSEVENSDWPTIFGEIFDAVFGERHLTFSCFWRSSIASAFAVTVMAFLVTAVTPDLWWRHWEIHHWGGIILLLAMGFIPINLVADYVSLVETRWIIRQMQSGGVFRWTLLLALDFLLTLLIFVFVLGCMLAWLDNDDLWGELVIASIYALDSFGFIDDPHLNHDGFISFLSIFLYSTLFTSIWVWAFYLAGLAIRTLEWVARPLDLESKPLHSIAYVLIGLVTTLFLIMPFTRL